MDAITGRTLTVIVISVICAIAARSAISADNPHANATWSGPGTCLECHETEANEVHGSVMYQWQGQTPEVVNGPALQGKISGGVNSYCINILGNWAVCGNCHVGLGALPSASASPAQLENIDCMICHQQAYRRTKVGGVFVPDLNAMSITMDEAVQTVHEPERFNCLQCHAKAGGGDAVKRGDLAMAHVATTDQNFDVHMALTGADLRCQDCHTTTNHRVAGRGSDIRPTDSDEVLDCSNCHTDLATQHPNSTIRRHLDRVACQTCHIAYYAKDAADTAATEATEVHRTWLSSHSSQPPYHPVMDKQNHLVPEYRFWSGMSRSYLLHDVAELDPVTGRYPTSRPIGHVSNPDSKLYAFKYKTAEQPITNDSGQLIALATDVFFASGDAAATTQQGLVNMGLDPSTPYSWIETDTLQMLNHQVGDEDAALQCANCHGANARLDLASDLGYSLWGSTDQVCRQCHGSESMPSFEEMHDKHVRDKGYDCSWCHGFARPERGLTPSSAIFRDGLESGDAFAWSKTTQ